jgi:hypothetical protein
MKKACGKALLILSSFVLALLMMEIVVRVLDLPPHPLASLPITDFRLSENPVISYEYQPGHNQAIGPLTNHIEDLPLTAPVSGTMNTQRQSLQRHVELSW